MKYFLFADESHVTDSRYRSIAAITLPEPFYIVLRPKLEQLMKDSDVTEFKWVKLNSAKYYFCAEKVMKFLFDSFQENDLRVDVIIWDTHDERHKIEGRDDIANFERMYFHLLSHTMKKRENNAKWFIYPDRRAGIDWQTIADCVNRVGGRCILEDSIFGLFLLEHNFQISEFSISTDSKEEPFVQVADLFAGLSIFSCEKYDHFQSWLRSEDLNYCLFEEEVPSFTNREKFRCKILDFFISTCKQKSLGVSLNSNRRLHTPNPKNPINFWNYQPQGEYDKAPRKSSIAFSK